MKPLPTGVKLKRVTTPAHMYFVKASYAVLVDGELVGHVDKHVQTMMTNHGKRGGGGQRHRTDTCWAWRRPGVRDDPTGYDRRSDAIDWLLLRSLDAPRETSGEE